MATVDLFAWPALRDAELAVAQAHAEWATARRRAFIAPHGQRETRQAELREVNRRVLAAEIELGKLRREAGLA